MTGDAGHPGHAGRQRGTRRRATAAARLPAERAALAGPGRAPGWRAIRLASGGAGHRDAVPGGHAVRESVAVRRSLPRSRETRRPREILTVAGTLAVAETQQSPGDTTAAGRYRGRGRHQGRGRHWSHERRGDGRVLTVDFGRFPVRPGQRVLDLGCGGGRHAFSALVYRRPRNVVAFDLDPTEELRAGTRRCSPRCGRRARRAPRAKATARSRETRPGCRSATGCSTG